MARENFKEKDKTQPLLFNSLDRDGKTWKKYEKFKILLTFDGLLKNAKKHHLNSKDTTLTCYAK